MTRLAEMGRCQISQEEIQKQYPLWRNMQAIA